MRRIVYFFCWIMMIGCGSKSIEDVAEISVGEHLLNAFPIIVGTGDTLHFYNEDGIEKPLPDSILKEGLPESLLKEIGFQTGDAEYEAILQFPLDDEHVACVLNVNEFWYRQQSLLVFDKNKKVFERIFGLSQLYGGDGGQVVVESWLWRAVGGDSFYQRESSHAMIMTATGEPEEFLSEENSLYQWNGSDFIPIEMKDSITLAKKFNLNWEW